MIVWPIVNVEVWDIGRPMPRQALPPPTDFADIADVDAVPNVKDNGKEDFRKFLDSPSPRAFAIAPAGTAYAWVAGRYVGNVAATGYGTARVGFYVTGTGTVPDVRPYIAHAAVAVAPRDAAIVAGDHLVEASLRLAARHGERFGLPRVNASCDYLSPARYRDVLSIAVSVEEAGRSSIRYGFRFSLGDRPVAKGVITVCFCAMTPQGISARPIPDWFRQRLGVGA